MNRREIINEICNFYDTELAKYIMIDQYDDFEITEHMSAMRFKKIAGKYGVSISELAKECDEVAQSYEDSSGCDFLGYYRQIYGLGSKYTKKSKDGKKVEYIKNPLEIHKEALYNLIFSKLKNYPNFDSLRTGIKFSRMIYINEYLSKMLDHEIVIYTTTDTLKSSLSMLSDDGLSALIDTLREDSYVNDDIETDGDYDFFSRFIDTAPIQNLVLLEKILAIDKPEVVVYELDAICALSAVLLKMDVEQLNVLHNRIKRRRTQKNIPDSTKEISEIEYPESTLPCDETLRYQYIQSLLSEYIDDDDVIPRTFLHMNELVWNIVRHTLRTFINPTGKNVENFYLKG